MTDTYRIIFVCLGNIVRSPLAENMFKELAEKKGLGNKYSSDSAGTAAYHIGDPPDERMRRVAAENGLIYSGAGRQFYNQDFDNFNLIIAMDQDNQKNILSLATKPEDHHKVFLMRKFDPDAEINASVPDPYYGGMDGFINVFKIVERSCLGLLEALENGEFQPEE